MQLSNSGNTLERWTTIDSLSVCRTAWKLLYICNYLSSLELTEMESTCCWMVDLFFSPMSKGLNLSQGQNIHKRMGKKHYFSIMLKGCKWVLMSQWIEHVPFTSYQHVVFCLPNLRKYQTVTLLIALNGLPSVGLYLWIMKKARTTIQ